MTVLAAAIAAVDMNHFVTQPDGRALPQSSAPAIIEALIRLADVRPGDRVIEIGTGSGYSAALLAAVIGDAGAAVSVEVDPTVAERARDKLAHLPHVAVVCGDGGQGAPQSAPFDRVIAWTTPRAIPEPWVRQVRDGGVVVTPVKVAPVALANLTVKVTVTHGVPAGVELHEGSFVDMTPHAADQAMPTFYVDAVANTGDDVPAWLSAPAVRDDAAAAQALLAGLVEKPSSYDAEPPSFAVVTAALAAVRPSRLATVHTAHTRGIGYATRESIAVATSGGILSHGGPAALDMLTTDLPDVDATLADYAATAQRVAEGWAITVTKRLQ